MVATVLADSGAIVAALDKRDMHHAWAARHFQAVRQSFVTREAAISESFFLLENLRQGKKALCDLIERGVLNIRFDAGREARVLVNLIRKYSDMPMSFADACLVRMSELHSDCAVFTTDSDFRTYRRNGRQIIPVIAPW